MPEMNAEKAALRIAELTKLINYYNERYYQDDISEISDQEFDALLTELITLETQFPQLALPDSPSQRVGGTVTKLFATEVHKYPMLSLGNTYNEQDLKDFDERVKKAVNEPYDYIAELKFDGVAISLIYENGLLTKAITRGDGVKGDVVTANVKTIRNIPLKLKGTGWPSYIEVRGEIFMPFKVFDAINEEKQAAGEPLLANPRNAASGTLKMQDSKIVAQRRLSCYVYHLLGDDLPVNTHEQSLHLLAEWGLPVSDTWKKCADIDAVMEYINYWEAQRGHLPLGIDGIVLKVNQLKLQKDLGFTAKSPRWAISFKYKAEAAKTKLLSVSYQVGRTGAITPVANLSPVWLAGTTVKRASIHNADEMQRLDLHEGDTVLVEKGGEIIPKITGVVKELRSTDAKPIQFIEQCPACGTRLVRKAGEAQHYCPNEWGCKPQITGKVEHFIQRKAMNIESLGPETIEALFEKGLIRNPADLYNLTKSDFLKLERFGEKSAENAVAGIQKSKEAPFEKVLFGMGIRYVGATVAEKLARHFGSLEHLMNADMESLVAVPEIGERIAESVIQYFAEPRNKEFVQQLKMAGLNLEVKQTEIQPGSDRLAGKSFVVSGVFKKYSREEMENLIPAHGGRLLSGVSSKLDFLVAGEKMGPSKLEKAQKLNVKIISEQEFLAMIGE
jgi:DNA ligase (NAD+)